MKIIDNVWLCQDCLIAECNGDYSGMSDVRAEEVQLAFDTWANLKRGSLAPNFDSETDEGVREFDNCECEICGTRLAGYRHRFAILK